MPKPLLLAPLTTLLVSCATCPTTPRTTDHCTSPAIPAPPHLEPGAAGDLVTLTVAETVVLARYVATVSEARLALAGCSLVTWSTK